MFLKFSKERTLWIVLRDNIIIHDNGQCQIQHEVATDEDQGYEKGGRHDGQPRPINYVEVQSWPIVKRDGLEDTEQWLTESVKTANTVLEISVDILVVVDER